MRIRFPWGQSLATILARTLIVSKPVFPQERKNRVTGEIMVEEELLKSVEQQKQTESTSIETQIRHKPPVRTGEKARDRSTSAGRELNCSTDGLNTTVCILVTNRVDTSGDPDVDFLIFTDADIDVNIYFQYLQMRMLKKIQISAGVVADIPSISTRSGQDVDS